MYDIYSVCSIGVYRTKKSKSKIKQFRKIQPRDSKIDNKLHKIKSNIGKTYFKSQLDRRKEQILHRLRIGHTFLTHAFLLKRENKPCVTYNCPLRVEHNVFFFRAVHIMQYVVYILQPYH